MPSISFEYFPAANKVQHQRLKGVVERLDQWQPEYVSVTYGAGGSSQHKTFDSVIEFDAGTNRQTAAHLTCAGNNEKSILELADNYWQNGIKNIVALRGDARPNDEQNTQGFNYASDLVTALKTQHDFTIRVAAYPEKHPEANSLDDDLRALKIKLDNGANEALTQFFFDADVFLRFRDKAQKLGIDGTQLVPGILPIKNFRQIKNFAGKCNTTIPADVAQRFSSIDDTALQPIVAADHAANICHTLKQEGVEKFHFYTLNDDTRTHLVLEQLEWFPENTLNTHDDSTSGGFFTTRRAG